MREGPAVNRLWTDRCGTLATCRLVGALLRISQPRGTRHYVHCVHYNGRTRAFGRAVRVTAPYWSTA